MYKGQYQLVNSWNHLEILFQDSDFAEGLRVWEIRTNRENNLLEHRQMTNRILKMLDQLE